MKKLTSTAGTAAVCLALAALFCATALAETETSQFKGSIAVKQEGRQAFRLAKTTLLDAVTTANAQQHVGQVVEAALEVENGFLVYSIDVIGASGTHTKAFVDAGDGKLLLTLSKEEDTDNLQVEEGDSAKDADHQDGNDKPDITASEASKTKVSLNDAVKTALTATPGTAVAVKLDNVKETLAYEVEILSSSGKLTSVAVNAATGKVVATEAEDSEENGSEGD
jgi:uncharacterized membrane protein YkoI